MMSLLLTTAILLGVAVSFSPTWRTCSAPVAPGDGFIPRNGSEETVKRVAVIEDGPDTVGFVYQSTDGKLYAQVRSGMSASDQHKIGITKVLPAHKTGAMYRYSPIVPMKRIPGRISLSSFAEL